MFSLLVLEADCGTAWAEEGIMDIVTAARPQGTLNLCQAVEHYHDHPI